MTELLQLLVTAASQGAVYAMLAMAYNMTFSTSKIMNFSLGDLLMVGGVVGFVLYVDMSTGQALGRSFVLPVLGVMLVCSVLGAFIFKANAEPSMKTKAPYTAVLATLAMGGVLRNLTERGWSTSDYKGVSPLGDEPLRFLGVGVYPQEILIIFSCVVMAVALEQFKKHTLTGRSIRAISEDAATASLMGINPKFVIAVSFLLSSVLAGVAGLLVSPVTMVSATMGVVLGIKAYAVSIIGGLESGYGPLAGGLILGLSEALTARYISSGYKDVTGFVILILIILFLPNGLFGQKSVRQV